MKLRNSECVKWTLVFILFLVCPYFVSSRPQDSSTTLVVTPSSTVHIDERSSALKEEGKSISSNSNAQTVEPTTNGRDVKTKPPAIRESIKMVTSQLLDKQSNNSIETPIVPDTRVPPKLKNQLTNKHKIKTRNEDGNEPEEKFHAGVAVPVATDDIDNETTHESSTSNEGITTWVLLSSPNNVDNLTSTTETTKAQETQKKQKPVAEKKNIHKPNATKRPIISSNKADLIASGSAINENVFNKLKDTVLTNVQKNKNTSKRAATSTTTTTMAPSSTESLTTKKKAVTKIPTSVLPVKVTSKPKKKNSNKRKSPITTTIAPEISDSVALSTESKEQEIELEISTPATTTKKPKRKKNKTKKRKTNKTDTEKVSATTEVKTSNKTKTKKTKTSKKPSTAVTPVTSQIQSYFTREVKAAVSVVALGLAGLVGLAGYFYYPFSTPVRRTFEVDKKDDLYRHNAEEYASEGNGQAEEEMLGTVLAGMPAHAKHKLNPYAGQTSQLNRYSLKKEQDIRYRYVTPKYEPNYNVRYPQQKTGIAHGAVYPEPVNYTPHQYETRHVYTTESKYAYEKPSYTPYSGVEPIYAAQQTDSEVSSYGNDAPSSVVYGVKPTSDTDFKPVYPYDSQLYNSETTSAPVTYAPTSLYLGSDDETDNMDDTKYIDESDVNVESHVNDNADKFVVGNVPKELSDTVTPAVVPEHGPRNLNRKKRSVKNKRSITQSIEEILRQTKDKNTDIFISNEIDDALSYSTRNIAPLTEPVPSIANIGTTVKVSEEKEITTEIAKPETFKSEIVESVSTLPLEKKKPTTVPDILNEVEVTTTAIKIYEVFTTPDQGIVVKDNTQNVELQTLSSGSNTETTSEIKSDSLTTISPSTSPISNPKDPISNPKPTYYPEVITYPPLNQDGGFFSFLKRLIEFKYRLGLSILQNTSEQLNRYLRNAQTTMQRVAKASKDSKQ